jgi:hypothetical protein
VWVWVWVGGRAHGGSAEVQAKNRHVVEHPSLPVSRRKPDHFADNPVLAASSQQARNFVGGGLQSNAPWPTRAAWLSVGCAELRAPSREGPLPSSPATRRRCNREQDAPVDVQSRGALRFHIFVATGNAYAPVAVSVCSLAPVSPSTPWAGGPVNAHNLLGGRQRTLFYCNGLAQRLDVDFAGFLHSGARWRFESFRHGPGRLNCNGAYGGIRRHHHCDHYDKLPVDDHLCRVRAAGRSETLPEQE